MNVELTVCCQECNLLAVSSVVGARQNVAAIELVAAKNLLLCSV